MKKIILILALALSNSAWGMLNNDKDFVETQYGRKHIAFCIRDGEIDNVRKGLAQGANVNSDYNWDWTLIETAINSNQMVIAKMLFDKGAARPKRYEAYIFQSEKTTPKQRFDEVISWYEQGKQALRNVADDEESSEESEFSQDEESSEEEEYSDNEESPISIRHLRGITSDYNVMQHSAHGITRKAVDAYCNCLQEGPMSWWKNQHIFSYIITGNEEAIKKILAQENADVNEIQEGRTPIEYALCYNELNLARIFFDAGALRPRRKNCGMLMKDTSFDLVISWYNQRDGMAAPSNGSHDRVNNRERLSSWDDALNYDEDENIPSARTERKRHMPRSSRRGGIVVADVYRNCLKEGPEVNWAFQHISLYIANGDIDAIKRILAQKNADINEMREGKTPIESAISFGKLDLAKIFFDAGALRPKKSNCGNSPDNTLFDQVIGWYNQKKKSDKRQRYTRSGAQSWGTQLRSHLPKVGLTLGTLAIVTIAGRYLYKKYSAKNEVHDNKSQQEG